MRRILPLLFALAAAPCLAQYTPPLGPHPQVAGPHTSMLTLGSTHLSRHSDQWKTAWLEPLLARLVAWRPQVITVEQLSGAQCETMRNDPGRYAESFDTYCWDVTAYQRSLKMTQAEAEAEAERRLAAWPSSPTAAQRRALAMLFMASGELSSAMVQWLRLPETERHAGDTLSEDAVKQLSRPNGRLNETYDIAAAVAARVGLERVYAVDDHTCDAIPVGAGPDFEQWQAALYKTAQNLPALRAHAAQEGAVHNGESLLGYYRFINDTKTRNAMIQSDFAVNLADADPRQFGRKYVGWWETRNLRMAANIRAAITPTPGARVLNLVGASHKSWYDQWARQMSDVDVVDASALLGH